MKVIEDPCPIESIKVKGKKKKTLKQKEKFLYAPYCNVNSLELENNEGYINIPDRFVTFSKVDNQSKQVINDSGVKMVRDLQERNKLVTGDISEEDNLEILEGIDYEDQDENVNKIEEKIKAKHKEENPTDKLNKLLNNYKLEHKPQLYKEKSTERVLDVYSTPLNPEIKDLVKKIENC